MEFLQGFKPLVESAAMFVKMEQYEAWKLFKKRFMGIVIDGCAEFVTGEICWPLRWKTSEHVIMSSDMGERGFDIQWIDNELFLTPPKDYAAMSMLCNRCGPDFSEWIDEKTIGDRKFHLLYHPEDKELFCIEELGSTLKFIEVLPENLIGPFVMGILGEWAI